MPGIRSTAWQKFRAGVIADAAERAMPCWICRRPIDYSITGRHPKAPSLDHLVPRFMGGDLLDPNNVAVCHYGCNARRGAVQRNRVSAPTPSRSW
jgi:5-methylcytosine-specific restriction endonuclease McrA